MFRLGNLGRILRSELSFLCSLSAVSSFYTGYLDGDGCIHNHRRDGLKVQFLGTQRFIRGFLAAHLGIKKNKVVPSNTREKTWVVEWAGVVEVDRVLTYLYPPGNDYPFLLRKRELAGK